jgi:hypothetical protein
MPAGAGAQTNDLGEYRLFSLPPGEYYVQVSRPDFGGSPATSATTMLPTYFPNTSDSLAAQPISVGAGQTSRDVEIQMVSAAAFQVTGVVIDETGRPLANAMVTLRVDEAARRPMPMMGPWHQSRTDTAGKFTINNVTAGTYTLLAVAPVVISRPSGRGAGAAARGGWFGFSSGVISGTASGGGGITTESSNGTTIQYRDDTGTRVPITIDQASVSGLEVTVRPPSR